MYPLRYTHVFDKPCGSGDTTVTVLFEAEFLDVPEWRKPRRAFGCAAVRILAHIRAEDDGGDGGSTVRQVDRLRVAA